MVFVTLAFTVLLSVGGIYFINMGSAKRLLDNEMRLEVTNHIQQIHKHLDRAHQLLDIYLLQPDIKYQDKIIEQLRMAQRLVGLANNNGWVKTLGLDKDFEFLKTEIKRYQSKIDLLIQIRLEPSKMYPAIAINQNDMLEANKVFLSSINSAIARIQNSTKVNVEQYTRYITTRDKWRRMVMAYRLYFIMKTTATQSTAELESNVQNVKFYIADLKQEFSEYYLPLARGDKSGLEEKSVIPIMNATLLKWATSFSRVEEHGANRDWRGDVPFIISVVTPISDSIYQTLDQLMLTMNLRTEEALSEQYQVSTDVSFLLWAIIVIFSFIFMLVYLLIDRSFLKPISLLAKTLTSEKIQDIEKLRPMMPNTEMMGFVNALDSMQRQMSLRENELEQLALHDSLTRLPNRTLFLDRVSSAIASCRRNQHVFSVIILNLDRLKEINDTLGHLIGDEILIEVANRIVASLRDSDTVARLGGDEFAILLPDINISDVSNIAKKISARLTKVYAIREQHLFIGTSVGVSLYPNHGHSSEILTQYAYVAMRVAKKNKNDYEIYNPGEDDHNVRRLSLLSDLRNAASRDQFYLEYQPIYDLNGRRVLAFEALIRWDHPEYGRIMPSDFICHAEQTGLIKVITSWVIATAAKAMALFINYDPNVYVTINITAWDLQDDKIVAVTDKALTDNNLSPECLVFELTERSLMNDSPRVHAVLNTLNERGIRFSLDDFGTGFSSMPYLTRLPVSMLKIDNSFVQAMLENDNDALIVRSVIELAHNLNLKVIAEGVEEVATLNRLAELGCDLIQGYLYGKPMSVPRAIKCLPKIAKSKSIIKLVS